MVGMEKAGKTNLLYKLKLGDSWKDSEMRRDLSKMREQDASGKVEDGGYHYEEINILKGQTCGVWELPGHPGARAVWPTFYRTIKFHAVMFIVDGSEKSEEKIDATRRHLHFLMNEDELRGAIFAVIVNIKLPGNKADVDFKKLPDELKASLDELPYRLGIHPRELHPSCAWRVKTFQFSVMDVNKENDPKLSEMRDWLKEQINDPKAIGLK